jgi:hypothetical protein
LSDAPRSEVEDLCTSATLLGCRPSERGIWRLCGAPRSTPRSRRRCTSSTVTLTPWTRGQPPLGRSRALALQAPPRIVLLRSTEVRDHRTPGARRPARSCTTIVRDHDRAGRLLAWEADRDGTVAGRDSAPMSRPEGLVGLRDGRRFCCTEPPGASSSSAEWLATLLRGDPGSGGAGSPA